MKTKFIKELTNGDKFSDEKFATKNVVPSKTKDGRDYLDLIVSDKTGEINAKVWEATLENCGNIKPGDIVALTGKVEEYRGKLQLNVSFLQKTDDFDMADFLKTTDKDIEKMWEVVEERVAKVEDASLKKLAKYFIEDEEFVKDFKQFPAGERMHHAYLGGLLEHTVEMLNLSETVSASFPNINMDLLTVGIILHDIGKLEEYTIDNAIHRTTLGNLIGHTVLGALRISKAMDEVKNFSKELNRKLTHMILSHQGKLEFGSPIRPSTREAVALYFLDDLSAKVNAADRIITDLQDSEREFSEYSRSLDTSLYLK